MEPHEYATLRGLEDNYWWYAGLRQLTFRVIQKYAPPTPSSKILDVGCGTGGNLAFFEKRLRGAKLYGVDIHPLAISTTRTRRQEGLSQASANELPFPDATFETVISLDVFYIRGVDDLKALGESYRVLKIGGIFVVNLPAFEFLRGEHDLAVHTRRRYTAKELREKLLSAGFTIRRLSYWNAFLFPLVLAARRFRWKRPVEAPKSDLRPLPVPLNEVLKWLLLVERIILSGLDLPFGSSVFAVGEKTQ